MSFLGKLSNALGFDRVWSIDEGVQRIAAAIDGSVHRRDDDLQVVGRRNEHPVRIIINHRGCPEIEVKHRAPVDVFSIELKYDQDAAQSAREQLDRTEWDGGHDEKLFVSPHVYLEGDRNELRFKKHFFDQLPDGQLSRLVQVMERESDAVVTVRFFWLEKEMVRLLFNDSLLVMKKDSVEQVLPILDLLTSISAASARALRTA